jgi:hypothetical protein
METNEYIEKLKYWESVALEYRNQRDEFKDCLIQSQKEVDRLKEALTYSVGKMTEIENDTAWVGSGLYNWCVRIKENLLQALNP